MLQKLLTGIKQNPKIRFENIFNRTRSTNKSIRKKTWFDNYVSTRQSLKDPDFYDLLKCVNDMSERIND